MFSLQLNGYFPLLIIMIKSLQMHCSSTVVDCFNISLMILSKLEQDSFFKLFRAICSSFNVIGLLLIEEIHETLVKSDILCYHS